MDKETVKWQFGHFILFDHFHLCVFVYGCEFTHHSIDPKHIESSNKTVDVRRFVVCVCVRSFLSSPFCSTKFNEETKTKNTTKQNQITGDNYRKS